MENKINYKGEDIYSAAVYYYGSMSSIQNTINIIVRFDKDIDPVPLRKALDLCQIRYPYLMIKTKKTFSKLQLVYNDLPIVIKNSRDEFVLSSAETNYHFVALRYYDNTLVLSIFHGLADSNGSFQFLRTLLYYYVSDRYGETISSEGIRLATDDIDPEEYTDPFITFVPDKNSKRLTTTKREVPSFRIAEMDSRVKHSSPYRFYLQVPQKDLIRYCKENDSSPATLFNLLVARAIKSLNPDITESIDGCLANDLRPALGESKSHYSSIGTITLPFDAKVQKLDVETQNTVFRGKTILANDVENIKVDLAGKKMFFEIIKKIPFVSIKKAMMQKIIKLNLGANTFMVSYVGKSNLGDIEKHIQGIFTDPDCPGTNIMLEVNAVNEHFYLSFIQEWKETLYFDAFCQEMKNIGLDYEVLEQGDFKIPKVNLY